MWYVVQTPVGREAEAAEKLNHFYRDKAEKPCFVLSKERTWRIDRKSTRLNSSHRI